MPSHEIDYKVIGDDIQLIEIELDLNETVIAEAGTMLYMEDGIGFEVKFGDGSTPDQGFMGKLFAAGSRVITGESLFITHFTNKNMGKRKVAFSAPYPGKIVPIDLSTLSNQLIVQKDGFLCAAFGTNLSIYLNRRLGSGKVWLQSMPIRKLIQALAPHGQNVRKEGRSLLGDSPER